MRHVQRVNQKHRSSANSGSEVVLAQFTYHFQHRDTKAFNGGDTRLGYQAEMVSLESPTYGRLWLLIAHHPGDTLSCTQAEALVLAAEARLGCGPGGALSYCTSISRPSNSNLP